MGEAVPPRHHMLLACTGANLTIYLDNIKKTEKGDPGVDERIILKWIFEKRDRVME